MPPKGVSKKKVEVKTAGKFSVGRWNTDNFGERIIIYGSGGVGKSTLASLAPKPVFIPLSDGAKEIRTPDGSKIDCIFGVETFQDVRDVLIEPSLWENYETVVMDDLTELEVLAEKHVLENYPPPKNQKKATSLRQYGFDGPGYLVEVMRLFLLDVDNLIRQGKHFIGLSHEGLAKSVSPEVFDFVVEGPKLQHNTQYSVRDTVYNHMDHVVRIDFAGKFVTKDKDEKRGKVEADETRIIATLKTPQYLCKSRPLRLTGKALPSEIAFSSPEDDSFWEFVGGCEVA